MRFAIVSGLLLATTVLAAPFEKRQSSTTCGNNYYDASQVADAANEAYNDYYNGNSPGGYPHTYNNYEGFSFPVSGPYLEFPLLERGIYNGGSPGADRVVINENGDYAGAITHSGARGNNFVGCSGTS